MVVYTVHVEGGYPSEPVEVFKTEAEAYQAACRAIKAHMRRYWCNKQSDEHGRETLEGDEIQLRWHDADDIAGGATVILRKHTLG